ncbi:glycoside hydrolase family 10 protein [Acholeplasma laidlawii]|uniref:glycoside hydrolase family 10 protein n=1 Tax=Acholeplasma laidlawii TaxID=2148 RepID=UPI000C1923D4|nr:family 10 glycosylhydrolase [Acholeplasma laidlawii]PII04060.1 hypothetical protein B9P96_003050 [Acholeplasma laidlawii]
MKIKKTIIIILVCLTTILLSGFTKPNSNDIKSFEFEFETNQKLRAVWVTPIVGEVSTFTTETAFKNEMNQMLDILEHYKINALIFHVRTHNNALYDSELNPKATVFGSVNFNNFDPLLWLVNETQSRGIEFHAWLNPYRVGTNYVGTMPAENPASNASNILSNPSNSALKILNPGEPVVRDFIVDTVIEIIEKYPVDAIHFDDYFYTNLGANGALSGATTILDEPDQQTYVTYGSGFNTTSATDKANWRRHQVNTMVQAVSNAIKNYNQLNGKHIQFGISPTGIYKNGNGVVTYDEFGKPVTTGSLTTGQTHYSSYLFSDSLHWIKEGWLDYIAPQSYWATNHSAASYYNVMGWWEKVVKYLDVNLYSGIGLYMADESTNTFNWKDDMLEMRTQLEYLETLNDVDGLSVYSYKYIRNHYNNQNSTSANQMENAAHLWQDYLVLPPLKSMEPILLDGVSNILHENGVLTFDRLDGAKQYYIYRSQTSLTYSQSEIVGVVGRSNDLSLSYNTGDIQNQYVYGIRALSYTNHLGSTTVTNDISMIEGASIRLATESSGQGLRFYANKPQSVLSDTHGFYIVYGETTRQDLLDAINNPINNEIIVNQKKVFKVEVPDVEVDGTYSVVITGIPSIGYTQKISVYSYYTNNQQTYISSNASIRSLLEVAVRMENLDQGVTQSKDIINEVKDSTKHIVRNAFNAYEITGIFETNHNLIKAEFIKDWNTLFQTNWTELNAQDFYNHAIVGKLSGAETLAGSRLYQFFNHTNYQLKWAWLLDYLLSIDGTVWTSRQIEAIKLDGTFESYTNLYSGNHLIYSIYNFFYESHVVGGYTAINFVTNKQFYDTVVNFSNSIYLKLDNYDFLSVGQSIKLPNPPADLSANFSHYLIGSTTYYPWDNYVVTSNTKIKFMYQ